MTTLCSRQVTGSQVWCEKLYTVTQSYPSSTTQKYLDIPISSALLVGVRLLLGAVLGVFLKLSDDRTGLAPISFTLDVRVRLLDDRDVRLVDGEVETVVDCGGVFFTPVIKEIMAYYSHFPS